MSKLSTSLHLKRLLVLSLLPTFFLSACKSTTEQSQSTVNANVKASLTAPTRSQMNIMTPKYKFAVGTSTTVVNRLALKHQCESELGASLVSSEGPVEIYHSECTNGRAFLAICELRQCKPLENTPKTAP